MFWLLFCVAAVTIRGVRWDENYEFAQVLTGRVVYPEGHPLPVYVRSAFSGQTWLSALMMLFGAGTALLCGFRNTLFMLAAVLPSFLFAARLTGKNRWGHLAAFLALEGVLMEFDGSYPIRVWPELYSNGQVGDGFTLIALFFLLAGGWRTAAALGGALPAIHLGQLPGIGVFGLLWIGVRWRRGDAPAIRRAVLWGAAAVGLCAALFLFTHAATPEAPESGPYAAAGDSRAIWQGFVAHEDPHRRLPAGNSQVMLLGALILTALACRREADPLRQRFLAGVLLYTGVIAVITWLTMAVHTLTQPSPPVLLLQWLPYRLTNHAAPLLLAVMVSVLARREWTKPIPVFLLVFALARPAVGRVMGEDMWRAYLFNGEAVTFALYGAALTVLRQAEHRRFLATGLPALLAAALLAPYHQYGAACVAGGALCGVLVQMVRPPGFKPAGSPVVIAAVCLLSAAPMLHNQWRHREHLPRSVFELAAADVLARQASPSSPLIAPFDTYTLQARLDHPVLIDAATGSFLTYLPGLAPRIRKMYEDVYGIRVDGRPSAVSWERVWAERDATAWEALGRKYGAEFLLAPAGIPVLLPEEACVLRMHDGALYRVYGAP